MGNWLQKRLKYLQLTHEQFGKRLAEQGIARSRVTITNWVNENTISLLANPEDTKRLAIALEWSVDEILVAAGFQLDTSSINIPPELLPHIKFYKKLGKSQQAHYLEIIDFVAKKLRGTSDINFDPMLDEELPEEL